MGVKTIYECDICGDIEEEDDIFLVQCSECPNMICDGCSTLCEPCEKVICTDCAEYINGVPYCEECYEKEKEDKKRKPDSDTEEGEIKEDKKRKEEGFRCTTNHSISIDSEEESDECVWTAEGLLHYNDGHLSPDASDEEVYYLCLACGKRKESKDAICLCLSKKLDECPACGAMEEQDCCPGRPKKT